MAKKEIEVSESASVGDDDLGASAETHAGVSAEVTDSSVVQKQKSVQEQRPM